MAKWYERSLVCVAYLDDVPAFDDRGDWQQAVKNTGWFRRGWTLQELLFPYDVIFCDRDWTVLPNLRKWSPMISEITNIPMRCLKPVFSHHDSSVACKMSWAPRRKTTRVEDEAYCLLGLFDVNMPLLYGEG
ncbi:Vegetative incompatibility protein HET-E-1 [Fulvia fulva]|uniref:Vegetative incompatibility protein HET-E-1 n=1 Tax=Passalora fulva TaxID=5499 RepID=A0A9Q8P7L4_PASFU|nr:Vegetative incompatibility protein HET-E-1 [Fulvia fulva]KAK4627149.1 Vegetative incompatibility protein HET-E-1 [Fulvia fulva]UJO16153.1 Vegetative incompatibility protein HET-E-1 [Fulvia fulva]WPV14334.1 Vegetative incompatibility protein HET-E-1 [Fulvia fulva]WPV28972.1 Vegetative incompatibility protein HET-E-1 [Fulvia fulva]